MLDSRDITPNALPAVVVFDLLAQLDGLFRIHTSVIQLISEFIYSTSDIIFT